MTSTNANKIFLTFTLDPDTAPEPEKLATRYVYLDYVGQVRGIANTHIFTIRKSLQQSLPGILEGFRKIEGLVDLTVSES